VGSDARDGDGAGVMTSIPHRFFVKEFAKEQGFTLPALGNYATGNLFFKPDATALDDTKAMFEDVADQLDLRVLGWRAVPRDSTLLGPAALSREPIILQPFVVLKNAYGEGKEPKEDFASTHNEGYFERQLYILRKRSTHVIGLHNWVCGMHSNKQLMLTDFAKVLHLLT
jgi:glutamate synthase (NADPH/NADH)